MKKDWGYSSVVQHLPSLYMVLDSIPGTTNKQTKKTIASI